MITILQTSFIEKNLEKSTQIVSKKQKFMQIWDIKLQIWDIAPQNEINIVKFNCYKIHLNLGGKRNESSKKIKRKSNERCKFYCEKNGRKKC